MIIKLNKCCLGRPYTNAAAMAKLYASETATFVAHQSIQVNHFNNSQSDFKIKRYPAFIKK